MRNLIKCFILVSSVWVAAPAFAQNTAAKASGNWENTSIWTGGAVPNSSNNVYIGATDPAGAVTTATVTLTANESAGNVFVGYGSPTNGTLNLGGNTLTITGGLTLNDFGGTGNLIEAGGSFTAGSLSMFNGNSSFTFGTSDAVTSIDIESGATLTTVAIGNITSGGSVANGGTLTLGANMSLSGGLNVEGTGATLNLAGHNLTIDTLDLGYFSNSAVNLNRGSGTSGALTVTNLDLANSQNLALITGDTNKHIDIENGATLTTAASGNITIGGSVASATLNLGADANMSGGLNVENAGAMLNLAGHNLTINTLDLGYFGSSSVTLNRGSGTLGTLTVTNLDLANSQNLALIAGDTVSNFDIENSATTLTTATTGNITVGGVIVNGATLNLGADANLSGGFNVEGTGSTLNLAGHNLKADSLALGYFSTSAVNFQRGSSPPGTLTLGNLNLGNGQNLALIAGDAVANIDIENGATLTTATAGNITGGGNVIGAALNLGANISLTGALNVQGSGGTLNLAGFNLSADSLFLGYSGSSAVTFQRGGPTAGTLSLNSLSLGNGQSVTMVAGDRITGGGVLGVGGTGAINLYGGATLTTVAPLNVTCTVNVIASTLNLGADTNIGNQTINAQNGAMLNLAGHNLAASYLLLAYSGASTVTLDRGTGTLGNLKLGNLFLGNSQNLNLISGDTIASGDDGVNITAGATLATAATTSITNNPVNIKTGGTLNLGASLSLGADLNVQDSGSTFNAQGHAVTAAKLLFGSDGTAPVTVSNLGTITASELHLGHGTSLALHGGDVINSLIDLEDSSVLTVQQSSSGTGLTLNGKALSDLTIDPSSMDLIFASLAPLTPDDWGFRWKDHNGSTNWISTLTSMIDDQQINLTLPPGQSYEVVDSDGYTYIEAVVPEPSSLVLMGLGLAALAARRVGRRRVVGSAPCEESARRR